MPTLNLVSGTVQMTVGSKVRLSMDFGNLPELIDGAEIVNGELVQATNITDFTVTCTGTGAPAVTGARLDTTYQLSAIFTASTAGNFSAVFSITLDDADATIITRTAPLQVV